MSMTISAANYLNGTRQDTRTSTSEKMGQRGGASKVGKTQQSAVSTSLDQVNMSEDGIVITEVSRQQGMEQSASQKQSAAPRMDTVEISAEGKAASTKLQARQTDTSATEEYQYEEENLSQYTDAELKSLLT